MTHDTWHWRAPVRAMAAVAAGLLLTPWIASAASGGTITFIGAITAPPLRISTASTTQQETADVRAASQVMGVAVSFSSAPGGVSGADVALQAVGAVRLRDAVASRFAASGGQATAAPDGHYRVGRDGGVLSLSPVRAGSGTPVVVVVSYD